MRRTREERRKMTNIGKKDNDENVMNISPVKAANKMSVISPVKEEKSSNKK
jgi:hypothetical protein